MPVWLQPYDDCYGHNFSTNFVDDILCPWNFYHGRFLYRVNSAEIPLTSKSHLLKNSCHHFPLVVFSSLIVLVGGYFYLGLSLSPATVWRAQSGFHTLRLGRIHLRESFLLKIGKTDLFMQSFEPLCMTSGSGPERLLNILLISSRVSCVWALGVVSSDI